MNKLTLCALFVFLAISGVTSSAIEEEAIEVDIEGRYPVRDRVSDELAKEMALYIARKRAVDLAGRYLSHKSLIERYELNRDEIYSLATNEIETDHFVGPLGRLAAGPEADQHAGDDGTIGLNLNAVLLTAQQTPAAEDMFEESEKYLNGPSPGVNQGNDLGGDIQQFGGDSQDPVAARTAPR